ncbi:MAG: LysE family translocator [Campylobacteraceae bacterium]|nr:LysE family translocator [Campylobacteraceae bacterium]
MIELTNLYLFLGASILLAFSPGPDNIYVMTQGITRSKKAAFVTTLGLSSGVVIHTTAAAFGISAIFNTSETAFNVVKFLGAFYLMYMAYKAFKHRNDTLTFGEKESTKDLKALYTKGFIMNILNPKVSIFFLAFLPQFVTVSNGNVPMQMIILGVVFMIVTIVVFTSMGIIANKFGEKIVANPSISKYLNTITAGVFFSLGLKLALSER